MLSDVLRRATPKDGLELPPLSNLLVGYWDPRYLQGFASDDEILFVEDLSGNGNHLAQRASFEVPRYSVAGVNGFPGMAWGGANINRQLQTADLPGNPPTPITHIFVWTFGFGSTLASTQNPGFGASNSGSDGVWNVYVGSTIISQRKLAARAANSQIDGPANVDADTTYVMGYKAGSTEGRIYRNLTPISSGLFGADSIKTWNIGRNSHGGNTFLAGITGLHVLYSGAMSAAEMESIISWVMGQYNVT